MCNIKDRKTMIKCIVVDDEPLAVKLISNYVERHPKLTLAAKYTDPIKAIHELEETAAELILLDIQMPQLSGIQVLKILNNKVPVILTTAYDEYALESYDYQVVDYLVKPISYERFEQSVEKYFRYIDQGTNRGVAEDNNKKENSNQQHSLFVKSGYKNIRIATDEILYIESKGDYLHIVTGDSSVIKCLENLKDMVKRVPSHFVQTHRSFVVNIDKIDYVENNRIVIKEQYIPISRAFHAKVMERLK